MNLGLASSLAIVHESRYTKKKKQKVETPWIATRLELMTMATHALTSSHILDDEDAPAAAAPAPSQPSLTRRLFAVAGTQKALAIAQRKAESMQFLICQRAQDVEADVVVLERHGVARQAVRIQPTSNAAHGVSPRTSADLTNS